MAETRPMIHIGEDGNPIVVREEILTPAHWNKNKSKALSMPYRLQQDHDTDCRQENCYCPPMRGEERFKGMTNEQVGAIRYAERYAAGDADTYNRTEDRILGKAKQQIEQTTTVMNFHAALDYIREQEAIRPTPEIVDVEVKPAPNRLLKGL